MRKPCLLAVLGACLFLGLALFAGLNIYRKGVPAFKFWALSSTPDFRAWVKAAPDPAELQVEDNQMFSTKGMQ